ncbi:bacillithiol biosynthesis cysteine-adding enzyme BshC [Bacillus massiliglaciei]|uniref:bacillithiol biosynthesis cysteine-adding enzyme BshC n=1 Tax=Bacillus massiliglaciei TaxID=1816693 RepID=UPI000ABD031E|nr:bacillithiol biosynthesis cysteine-adding enzyme BshC [Bacillus massiliglaciei]
MEMKDIELPSLNKFASDYLTGSMNVEDYFHYNLSDREFYQERVNELMERSFLRKELSDYIQGFMHRFPKSEAVERNIADLRHEESVVVIGGQQAGLLTGPLYTIHKVISIIKLAEEQEKRLGRRVIPVFWIAGEDHDLAEVNHIYWSKNGKVAKNAYPIYQPIKSMITDTPLEAEKAEKWFEEILESYGETSYSKGLLSDVWEMIRESHTFVDFFTALIHRWFHKYGLLMLDAGDPELRKLESAFFERMIKKSDEIRETVLLQQKILHQNGYKKTIEIDEDAANLFYYDHIQKERSLLKRTETGFAGKNGDIEFSENELIDIARKHPERLSNNVVTRPLMQELLFPVLAFISGPGEIAYWAELKKAFDLFEIKMPPIIPRLNITFLERGIESDRKEMGLDLSTVLTEGSNRAEKTYKESIKDKELEDIYTDFREDLLKHHQKLSSRAEMVDKELNSLMDKNRRFLEKQLEFAYRKIQLRIEEKHSVTLRKYNRIERSLFPDGSPQERIWNIFYYLNKYGPAFLDQVMELDFQFNNMHKVIKL